MLLEWFPGGGARTRGFFGSWQYYSALAAGMAICNLFSLELPFYFLCLVLLAAVVLFGEDLKGVLPLPLVCYMAVSAENNPARDSASGSAFYRAGFRSALFWFALFAVLLLAVRLLSLQSSRRGAARRPALASGFLLLGASFVLGGLLTPHYGARTALFGATEIVALSGLYFVYLRGILPQSARGCYGRLFTCLGAALVAEIAGMYLKSGILWGLADRGGLVTGWGIYNNVGCALAMCLPAPLYLASKAQRGGGYLLFALLLLFGLVLTQSRGAILFGSLVFLLGIALALRRSQSRARLLAVLLAAAGLLGGAALALFLLPAPRAALLRLFSGLLLHGFDNNGRFAIYADGLGQFCSAPLFGVGFYECKAFRWGDLSAEAFLPPRYHNTLVQLLASGGLFSLLCYALHRAQTLKLFFRRRTPEKDFIFLSVLALLSASLVDCHFFNLGPGIFYATFLFLAERNAPRPAAE